MTQRHQQPIAYTPEHGSGLALHNPGDRQQPDAADLALLLTHSTQHSTACGSAAVQKLRPAHKQPDITLCYQQPGPIPVMLALQLLPCVPHILPVQLLLTELPSHQRLALPQHTLLESQSSSLSSCDSLNQCSLGLPRRPYLRR